MSGSDSFFAPENNAYITGGCDRSETIDIQSSQAVFGAAKSLSNQVIRDFTAHLGAIRANIFDGKSDGKSFPCILLVRFTVRRSARRCESLVIKAFAQWCLTAFRESASDIADSPTPWAVRCLPIGNLNVTISQ